MFAGVVRREHVAAKAVGSFLPRLTRKAFEKHGFAAATLLTDWARIVGAEIARYAQPERIKWPKGDPARAMDIEYRRAQLAERINGYFGYRAIGEIRIVQTPIVAANAGAQPAPPMASAADCAAPRAPASELVAIADDGLRQALTRMQAGIEATRPARSCLQRAADTRTAG